MQGVSFWSLDLFDYDDKQGRFIGGLQFIDGCHPGNDYLGVRVGWSFCKLVASTAIGVEPKHSCPACGGRLMTEKTGSRQLLFRSRE